MKLFFCIKNMGKRKGKKSSKSRKKTSSKAGKDGSLQKESSRNYSQSKSIITNAHLLMHMDYQTYNNFQLQHHIFLHKQCRD